MVPESPCNHLIWLINRGVGDVVRHNVVSAKHVYRTTRQFQKLLETEREWLDAVDLSPTQRLHCYRRGFLSRAAVLYDFDAHDPESYLTGYQRFVRTRAINGKFGVTLDNKLLFPQQVDRFDEHLPTLWGLLSDERIYPLPETPDEGPGEPRPADEWLSERLAVDDRLVLKWIQGGGGENVLIVERDDEGFLVNGEPLSREAFREQVRGLEQYLVTAHVDQAEYSASMFPDATNTIRVVTMWDGSTDEPFVARAVHRIGVASSAPMDNFGRGGLSALVDRESGELGPGARLDDGEVTWQESHPDTGHAVEGRTVPGWESIRERLLTVAESLPHLPYVGWDVVVTGPGEFEIVEANNYPGVKSLQVHGPLLSDDRVREFYRTHDVIDT